MFYEITSEYLPPTWSSMNPDQEYELVEMCPTSQIYQTLKVRVQGAFNLGISKIVRVQNPYLYGQYLLKKQEYETRGSMRVIELYHDTAEWNIYSIASGNLDWRMANRVKYGKGVSFSPSPSYANKESSRANGTNRAMIVADVLTGNIQMVAGSLKLPRDGRDTTLGNNGQVYVKYYDNEFYPKYVVYYKSRPFVPLRRYW